MAQLVGPVHSTTARELVTAFGFLICALGAIAAAQRETGHWKLETGKSKSEITQLPPVADPLRSLRALPQSWASNDKSRITNHKSLTPGERRHNPPGPALITTPALSYSTYLGASGFDAVRGIAVDLEGNIYVTGYTNSPDFPAVNGAQSALAAGTCGSGEDVYSCFDAFIAKFDPTGQELLYATYFGGSGEDYASGIGVDGVGNAYIAGYTNSLDLPSLNAAQAAHGGGTCGAGEDPKPCFDAFVAKLNATGSELLYSTYLGGSGDDFAQGIAVDAVGNAVVTGLTTSTDFPTQRALRPDFAGGAYEAFVTKLDTRGAEMAFSTYLGGSGDDFGTHTAVDISGDIYLTGYTNSVDFPVARVLQSSFSGGTCGALASTFPCFDGYVGKLTADGSKLEYLTYLGGTGGDYAYGIAVDGEDSAYVAGMTTSRDFPTTFDAFKATGGGDNTDAFVAKLDPSGSWLVYSTYLGGTGAESASGVAVDSVGRAFVTGYTYGAGLPLVNPVQGASGGFYDVFLAALNEGGTGLEFSTYLGGTGHEKGRGLALDRLGNGYVGGETFSSDFPTAGALQAAYGGGAFDGFMARFALGDLPVLYLSPAEINFGAQRVGTTSATRAVTLTNIGGGDMRIEAIGATGDFSAWSDCATLAPGARCEVALAFAPSVAGTHTATLMIQHDGAGEMSQVALNGTGIAPVMSLSANSVSFGPQLVGTESRPQAITLTNSGTASLELSGIAVSGEFTEASDCPMRIEVAGSCTLNLTFAPKSTGERVGTLTITHSLPAEARTVALVGTGTDFSLVASPEEATVAAGESATFTLTLTPAGGFQAAVSLTCSGAPKAASCSISPASLALNGISPAEAQIVVRTKARAMAPPCFRHGGSRDGPLGARRLVPFLWLAMAGLLAEAIRRMKEHSSAAKQAPAGACATLVLLLLVGTAACGGRSHSVAPSTPEGTPPGTYTLTFAGSCEGVTRSTTVHLTVK